LGRRTQRSTQAAASNGSQLPDSGSSFCTCAVSLVITAVLSASTPTESRSPANDYAALALTFAWVADSAFWIITSLWHWNLVANVVMAVCTT
jgi:hypothetical protein